MYTKNEQGGKFCIRYVLPKEKKNRKYLEKNEKENTKTLQNSEAVLREKFIRVNMSTFFKKRSLPIQ